MPQIDYNALAQQAGAISSQAAPTAASPTASIPASTPVSSVPQSQDNQPIDYAALARQAGAIDSTAGTASDTPDIDPAAKRALTGFYSTTLGPAVGMGKEFYQKNADVIHGAMADYKNGKYLDSFGKLISVVSPTLPDSPLNQLGKEMSKSAIDQLNQEWDKGIELGKNGRYAEAAGHLMASVIPFIGPAAAHAGEQIGQGNIAGGLGEAAGLATAVATPDIVAIAKEKIPEVLGVRATKARSAQAVQDFTDAHADVKKAIPSQGASRYEDTDMVRARDYLEKHHEDTQPIRSVSDYRDAADTEIKKIDGQVKDLVNIIPNEKIATNVLDDVRQGLEQISPKKDFVDAGMKALTDSYDLNDPTMTEADRIREDLNAENQGVMSKNNYKRSVARKTDPGFAARELAASSLRDGVYNQLENHGIEGARELRLDQGSLIKMRNAAEAQIPNGGKIIRGTGGSAGLAKNVAKAGITGTAAAAGGAVGSLAGPVGTGVGAAEGARIGSDLANRVLNVPSDLTRDQLIERSFGKKVAVGEPTTPTINLRGPAAPEPTGQQPLPTGPSTLFDINQTGPEAFAQRAKPYQDIIDSPNHTPAEKADAHQAMADLHKEVDKAAKETGKQAKAASKPAAKAPAEARVAPKAAPAASTAQPEHAALEAGQKALAAESGTVAPKFQSGNRAIIASGETPKSPEWLEGERQHEVNRLKEIIRNPKVTPEELKIAQDRLFNYLHPEVIAGSNALK